MKIETTKVLKTLSGENYTSDGKDLTLGLVLAEAIATYEIGGKMKAYVLANKLYNSTEDIELDEADLSLVKKALESCKAYNTLIVGQALLALEA